MARWQARFDSGSNGGWEVASAAGLDTYFERRRIGASSASAALLRNGLISSRSLLSADIYEDLNNQLETAASGTYFPPDTPVFSTDGSTYVSWSSAYTSSIEGIKFTNTNTYGTSTTTNYSTRPTGSVLSTNIGVGQVNPANPVGASYTTYTNTTNAVRAVLDVIQDGAATISTPFTRGGLNASRTNHSIWHDPDLQYFAWDDFTPGTPPGTGYSIGQSLNTVTIGSTTYTNALLLELTEQLALTGSWTGVYKADFAGTSSLTASLRRNDNDSLVTSTTVDLMALPPTGLAATWSWSGLSGLGTVADGYSYDFVFTASFKDARISSHTSSKAMNRSSDIVHVVGVNAVSLRYAAAQNGLCGTNGTTATFYLSNGATQPSTPNVYVFSVKNPPTIAPINYYVLSTETVINGGTIYTHDGGGQFTADTATCP
jgi:hypothetical protein